eukprot:360101-Chlamydomonas_euryale.AAC.6
MRGVCRAADRAWLKTQTGTWAGEVKGDKFHADSSASKPFTCRSAERWRMLSLWIWMIRSLVLGAMLSRSARSKPTLCVRERVHTSCRLCGMPQTWRGDHMQARVKKAASKFFGVFVRCVSWWRCLRVHALRSAYVARVALMALSH